MELRSPIITICGHVDHGKTSLLDILKGSKVAEKEAGNITQKIYFTRLSKEIILKEIGKKLSKKGIKLDIPGFLLIDTPGHAAFTNLRKRGGSLADLAVLVIDVTEGIKPQTAEVIQILKLHKTPFVIALNKIDKITGWKKLDDDLNKSIEMQPQKVKQQFEELYMTLMGSLYSHGFEADLYNKINDFTKKIAMVPTSTRTKEGIPELIMMLCGLSQKYLSNKLELSSETKGVMLEIKKEKNNNYIEAILYDGELVKSDEIAVSNFDGEPILTKIRILEEIEPLCPNFKPAEKVKASSGIRMQLVEKNEILPGMPFMVFKNNLDEIRKNFKKEISETMGSSLSKQGIIAKADSLGSLEALIFLLKQNNIPLLKVGIGKINKTDLISAKANLEINELDAVIVGFNVEKDEEVNEISSKIKIIQNDVVYKLIDDLVEWRKEKQREIEKKRLMGLSTICKLEILHQYIFRNTKPAIFGVKVLGGKLISGLNVIDEDDEKIGHIKNIQSEKKSVAESTEGMEVAISIPGLNYERQLKNKKFLYSNLSESQFREFKKNKDLLSQSEIKTIQEIAEIKRKIKADWGA